MLVESDGFVLLFDVANVLFAEKFGMEFEQAEGLRIEAFGMGAVDFGGADSHGAIDEDGDLGESGGSKQLMEKVDHGLCSADAKGRDEEFTSASDGLSDDLAEVVSGLVEGFVEMSTIGGFAEDEMGRGNRSRGTEDGDARSAQVAGEGEGTRSGGGVEAKVDHGRTEQVSGLVEGGVDAGSHLEGSVIRDGFEAKEGAVDVGSLVEGFDLRFARSPLTIEILGIFFLNFGGIAEHHGDQGACGRSAVDRAEEALLDEVGQIATVIDMGVAEQDGSEVTGSEGEGTVLAQAFGS